VHSLPIFLRLADRAVILLGDGPMADAKARLLDRAGARRVGEADDAAIAIVAYGDARADAAAGRLKARGLLVNVVDRPDLSDFTFPAIVDRDPVLVAIGTGGASAGLAAALRQRIEVFLPAGLGGVARALHAARSQLQARFPALDDRRRASADLRAPGGALDPLINHDEPGRRIADAAPASARTQEIRITSPDPDDLTIRAARLLGLADRIYHDAELPTCILDRARGDAERIAGTPPLVAQPGLTLHLLWRPL
jgi:uroporphyrin-III C-methyltransferase / precorrin-2 dehydrogenase / sirohydrochlorin ferrochelatase